MRIPLSAFAVFVVTAAIPSTGIAQVLAPFRPAPREHRLEHVVPVATVNLVGDVVELADPVIVQVPSAEPFVLGAASLDLRDPAHGTIRFTMTNASRRPIPWNTVEFSVERADPVPMEDQMRGAPDLFFCRLSRRGLAAFPQELWQPGVTVAVQVPIVGDCLRRAEPADPLGFLVYAGRMLPHPDLSLGPPDPAWEHFGTLRTALLRRAIEKLTSTTQQ